MSSDNDDAVRERVRRRLDAEPTSTITAATLDEVVLEETGTDVAVKDLFDAAEKTRFDVVSGARAAENAGTSLNCFGLLAVIAAAAAWGGVFGRYESPGWIWMLPTLAPVVAVAAVIVAVFSFGRPTTRMASASITIGWLILAVAGGIVWWAFDLESRDRWLLLVSIGVGGAAVLWVRLVRMLNSDESRDLELALLRARREARARLTEERAEFLPRLEPMLTSAQVDLGELDEVWALAAHCVAKRPIGDLHREDGPVGSSKLALILSIPRDQHDRAGEEAEAEWKTRSGKA